jgi:hypothetical protein
MSPGSCDQGVRVFLLEKPISDQQLDQIQNKPPSDGCSYETGKPTNKISQDQEERRMCLGLSPTGQVPSFNL